MFCSPPLYVLSEVSTPTPDIGLESSLAPILDQHHLSPEVDLPSSLSSQGNVTPYDSIHAREADSYGKGAHTLNHTSQNVVVINDAQNSGVINDAQNVAISNDAQPVGGYATSSISGVSAIVGL
ncbi:hypothetical protein V6N11_077306 [Hibiscus sabdariffa]|uniref:Uncharacterized protein n=1 Tax=Hibiscus sabdariffa TaxID=183260 RepID=A0ABR2TDH3_9ROSI